MAHETQMGLPTAKEVNTLDVPNGLSVAFDIDAFDEHIRAHGVAFKHYRAMLNPLGLLAKNDSRRPDPSHGNISNAMVYTCAGVVTALLVSNSKNVQKFEGGLLNAATASLTPARFYDDAGSRVYLSPFDRLYLCDETVLVTRMQLVEAHETGVDRLDFPAVEVLDIMDARGVRYKQETDFCVKDGNIHWCGNQPGINVEAGKGVVYGVRYLYRPHWYVDQLMHEIRVAQYEDPITGERRVEQMPQAAIVKREHVYLDQQNDPEAPASPRQAPAPASGSFSAR